ncbi:zinc-ribbon domain-containing protein [Solirubrobacter taibaiensis]|nr:zinc-ribbon domain-containing protein [Solirubrobacter taibaiensis]
MPTANVRVAHRPVRIGFLVRRSQAADVAQAAELATLLWGGFHDPIITVDDNRDRVDHLIAQFQVDALVAVADDDQLRDVANAHPHLDWPPSIHHAVAGHFAPAGAHAELPAVDVRVAISHLWNTHFAHQRTSPYVMPRWRQDHELATLLTVTFGRYGTGAPGPDSASWFLHGLSAGVLDVEEVPSHLGADRTPLGVTRLGLVEHRADGQDGIVVGDPENADHLAAFWNMRAMASGLSFWPTSHAQFVESAIDEQLAELAKRPASEQRPLQIWLCSGVELAPEELTTRLPASLAVSVAPLSDEIWDGPVFAPRIVASPESGLLGVVEEDGQRGGMRMVFGMPEHPFSKTSAPSELARWLVSASLVGDAGLAEHTLRLPYVPALNGWYGWELTNGASAVRVERSAFSVFSSVAATSLSVRCIQQNELVAKLFEGSDVQMVQSSAGRAAQEVMRLVGGLTECARFRIPGVRAVLRTEKWQRWRDAQRQVATGGLEEFPGATAGTLLEFLAFNGLLHAGLQIQCPNCGIRHQYTATELGETIRCPRCRETFPLTPFLHDSTWVYRPSGFFAGGTSHGVIPVLLTMLRLKQDYSGQRILLSSHELIAEGPRCESDLIVSEVLDDGRVAVALSECKDQGKIEPADIANLSGMALRLADRGIDGHVIFSTLREEFTASELDLFRQMQPSPILFTARELCRSALYDRSTRTRVRHSFKRGLREMAENSADLYLNA